jgi:hypothetical protein
MANSNPNKATRFKKGQSGNQNGRPSKGYSITETIRDMMAKNPEIKKKLGNKIIEMALRGDINAMKIVWQYMDGMPKQPIELSNPEEKARWDQLYEEVRNVKKISNSKKST